MVLVDTSVWIRFLSDRAPVAAGLERLLTDVHGRGIGWIDAHLLASALVGQVSLWTTDLRLGKMADELGIAYP